MGVNCIEKNKIILGCIILLFLFSFSITTAKGAISCTEYTAQYDCLTYYGGTCTTIEAPQMTTYAVLSDTQLDYGDSTTITIRVTNDDDNMQLHCSYQVDGGTWSSPITVNKGSTVTIGTPSITAPTTQVSQVTTKDVNVNIHCDGEYYYIIGCWCANGCQLQVLSYTYPLQSTIDQQNQQASASSAITTAQNLISEAQSAINDAQAKITEANNIGADITTANSYLSTANTYLQNAQTQLSSAQSSYSIADYTSASTYAQQAQTSATNAKNSANSAKTAAEQAIQQVSTEQIEASNKISDANSAIDTAKKSIDDADSLINNATIIGMDTTQAEADVATARSKVQTAETYLSEATTAFNSKNYDLAKSKADSAKSYANSADSIAISAYNTLWVVYAVSREAGEAIATADTTVSQMNEILTKLDYVLRSIRTYGIDTANTDSVVTEAKINTNTAEDLLSQSKNKLNSGYNTDAVNLANSAKTSADSAYNRLDTIVLTLSFSIQDGLDEAYLEKESNLESARQNVQDAANTYGSDSDTIITAQDEIADAEAGMIDASSKMSDVESASSLTDLVENAELAFSALDDVQQHTDSANSYANAARMGLINTVAGAIAVTGAAGGGFLYWRKKKGKGRSHKKEIVAGVAVAGAASAAAVGMALRNRCKKCGSKVTKNHKFCHKCGKKVN